VGGAASVAAGYSVAREDRGAAGGRAIFWDVSVRVVSVRAVSVRVTCVRVVCVRVVCVRVVCVRVVSVSDVVIWDVSVWFVHPRRIGAPVRGVNLRHRRGRPTG
jgi:hypothetical protein